MYKLYSVDVTVQLLFLKGKKKKKEKKTLQENNYFNLILRVYYLAEIVVKNKLRKSM